MSSRLADAFARMVTECHQGRHRYHPTWTPGHMVCLDCASRAVCPVCVPQTPDATQQLVLCGKHQPKEVEL